VTVGDWLPPVTRIFSDLNPATGSLNTNLNVTTPGVLVSDDEMDTVGLVLSVDVPQPQAVIARHITKANAISIVVKVVFNLFMYIYLY